MNLKSQETRRLAPEMDPLRMGMGWTAQDLEKPQVLIESTYGQSHPGSAHLLQFAQEAAKAADAAGAKSALYFATDMCDGMSQGHDGGNYSLVSRDTIANLIEIHANATTFDAGVFIASCDKSVPAQLMAIGRINIPSISASTAPCSSGGRYRRSSSPFTSTTPAPPAGRAPLWGQPPPCRLWPRPWG